MDNVPVWVARRRAASRHPTMHAIRTTQTIVHREALARDEAMAEVVSKLRCIVRMDGLYDRFQAAHAGLVTIRYIQAEEIHHDLAKENRLSVRRQSPRETGSS